MLSECQTAWIRVRRRVTRRLNQIQADCRWNYSCAWRAKGNGQRIRLTAIEILCLLQIITAYIHVYESNIQFFNNNFKPA